jgi:hypothetical protein
MHIHIADIDFSFTIVFGDVAIELELHKKGFSGLFKKFVLHPYFSPASAEGLRDELCQALNGAWGPDVHAENKGGVVQLWYEGPSGIDYKGLQVTVHKISPGMLVTVDNILQAGFFETRTSGPTIIPPVNRIAQCGDCKKYQLLSGICSISRFQKNSNSACDCVGDFERA